jgi:hypothetical protein
MANGDHVTHESRLSGHTETGRCGLKKANARIGPVAEDDTIAVLQVSAPAVN